jgi:hypothetical protein
LKSSDPERTTWSKSSAVVGRAGAPGPGGIGSGPEASAGFGRSATGAADPGSMEGPPAAAVEVVSFDGKGSNVESPREREMA